jgi:hypothetical protein
MFGVSFIELTPTEAFGLFRVRENGRDLMDSRAPKFCKYCKKREMSCSILGRQPQEVNSGLIGYLPRRGR